MKRVFFLLEEEAGVWFGLNRQKMNGSHLCLSFQELFIIFYELNFYEINKILNIFTIYINIYYILDIYYLWSSNLHDQFVPFRSPSAINKRFQHIRTQYLSLHMHHEPRVSLFEQRKYIRFPKSVQFIFNICSCCKPFWSTHSLSIVKLN